MATEDVLVTAKLDVPGGGLPDMSELPSATLANIPPDALGRAFGIAGRGRPMEGGCPPATFPPWPAWGMDSLMALHQLQAFSPTGMLPLCAPGYMPPGFATTPAHMFALYQAQVQALREAGMTQPGSFYGPVNPGAAQIGAGGPWASVLPENGAILQAGANRVPVSQGAPGWNAYPASRPGPGGGALPGIDFNNNGQGCNGGVRRDGDPQPVQRSRMVWTPDLHQRFLEAVKLIGVDQAVPKKIMQVMKVDYLTRENVASHLQKYRLQLKREQENKSGNARRNRSAGATPSYSAAQPAAKVSAGRRTPQEEVGDAADAVEGVDAVGPREEKEQPVELQDTAASILAGSKAFSGRQSISGRSPGSACTHVEKKQSGGEGSRSLDSGSSRTMEHKGTDEARHST